MAGLVVAGHMNDNAPQRRTPVHLPAREAFNRSIVVFVTVCTDKRRPLLCDPEVHRLLVEAWHAADRWHVGSYVIMPDHVHFFCAPAGREYPPLGKWVQYWKAIVSRRWRRPEEQPIWQKSFWDTQLRRGESYGEKWECVRQNPVRKGLAMSPEEWLFQGELHVLEWHD